MRDTHVLARLVEILRARLGAARRRPNRNLTASWAVLEDRVLLSATPVDPAALGIDDVDLADDLMADGAESLAAGSLEADTDLVIENDALLSADAIDPSLLADSDNDLAHALDTHEPVNALLDDAPPVGSLDVVLDDGHEHDHVGLLQDGSHSLCALPVVEADDGDMLTAPTMAASEISIEDTFLLHSNPGASHTIYLDFDGHVTSGTYWNSSYNGGNDIVTAAYDFDGNSSSFSTAELERIQYIWQRVAEDFIPFDVDVTTEAPVTSDLINSGGSDSDWGVRVVVGGSSYDWYGASAGGVAYVGSFDWSTDTPAFVFEAQLGNGNEKYVAEAISHETGHTVGLSHDGNSSTTYYAGHGSGQTGWAPIMGNGYYKNLTQWSEGEYSNANNTQDDLAIITSSNGFGYRADDHGSVNGLASSLDIFGNTVSDSGIIEQNTDVDVFSFSTDGGTIELLINPFDRGPNLDLLAELYDAASNLVLAANPLDVLSASINTTVSAGQYFLHISGVGFGDPATGYSDYGSLGQYAINGTINPSSGDSVSIAADNASQPEGDSGSTVLTFSVTRTGDLSDSTSVDYFVSGSGADPAEASDFANGVLPSGTVLFAPGETIKTIQILADGDTEIESDETFAVTLTNAAGDTQIAGAAATGTIVNDDTLDTSDTVSIAATDAVKSEGDSGITSFTFTVTRNGYLADSTSVGYSVTGSGADPTEASDFAGGNWPSGSVTFAAGETSKTITIEVLGDTDVETDEGFAVSLGNATGDTQIIGGEATATVLNDDTAPPPVAGITVTPTSGLTTTERGRTATFNIVLDSQPDANVYVNLLSLDTTEGVLETDSLVFTAANWNLAQTITVRGVDDTVRDGNVGYTVQVLAAESSDAAYNGLDADDVQLTNQDNDKGGKGNNDKGGNNKGGKPKKSDPPGRSSAAAVPDVLADDFSDETIDAALDEWVQSPGSEHSAGTVTNWEWARALNPAQTVRSAQSDGLWPQADNPSGEFRQDLLGDALRALYSRGDQDDESGE